MGHKNDDDDDDKATQEELDEQRKLDQTFIRKLGQRTWEKAQDDAEYLLNMARPNFFERSDKRHTDTVAHIKHSSQAMIATINNLEKASKMRTGQLGKENFAEKETELTAEKLLEMVQQKKNDKTGE